MASPSAARCLSAYRIARRLKSCYVRRYAHIEAHRLLASAYLRQGKYREALLQVNAVLALRPGDADAKDADLLLTSLGELPDQEVARTGVTAVELQGGELLFSINDVQATYWFDTGANVSILSESEAKRIGLAVRALSHLWDRSVNHV
jgi:hypothetical protein